MNPQATPLMHLTCPVCGGANQCAAAATGTVDVACWCTQVTIDAAALARVPAQARNRACLCPRCAGWVDEAEDKATGEALDGR